jgi:hypothetical protein
MNRELLIDALEEIKYLCSELKRTRAATQNLIETIEEELAKPEQKPFAYGYIHKVTGSSLIPVLTNTKKDWADSGTGLWEEIKLYKGK